MKERELIERGAVCFDKHFADFGLAIVTEGFFDGGLDFSMPILAGLGKLGQDRLAFGRFRSRGRFKVHGIDPCAKSFVGNECREIGGFQNPRGAGH